MEPGLRSTPRVRQRFKWASVRGRLNDDHYIREPSSVTRQRSRMMSGRARPPKARLEPRCTAVETLRYREIAIFELSDRKRNRGFRDTAALSFRRMKAGNSGLADASMTPEPNLAATHKGVEGRRPAHNPRSRLSRLSTPTRSLRNAPRRSWNSSCGRRRRLYGTCLGSSRPISA
jgi:hypothetical protein